MTQKTPIGPRISETAKQFLEKNFSSRHAGAEFVLAAFPGLYKRAFKTALSRLDRDEQKLLLDVHNGYAMTPEIIGQVLIAQVEDGIDLDGLDKKWGIDKKEMLTKLNSLSFFELACLEIWATAFWQAGHWDAENAIDNYIT